MRSTFLVFPIVLLVKSSLWAVDFYDLGPNVRPNFISTNGSVVIGSMGRFNPHLNPTNFPQAFRWTSSGGISNLEFLPGDSYSVASGISADGLTVVGSSVFYSPNPRERSGKAVRWIQGGGVASYFLEADGRSSAAGLSAGGDVIVGTHNSRAFRYNGGLLDLGLLPGGGYSSGVAVSANGETVLGNGDTHDLENDSGGDRAFLWKQNTGIIMLGLPDGTQYFYGSNLSGDGNVVIG